MKAVVIALGLFAAGLVAGYYVRVIFTEDRTQRNLASLSGESLSRMDDIGRLTREFSAHEIDRRWKEKVEFTRVEADIPALKEAWQAWESAIIYQQVEKVGWSDYRTLVIHNSGRYLSQQQFLKSAPTSEFAKKEVERASDMIHEAIPVDELAKSGPFY